MLTAKCKTTVITNGAQVRAARAFLGWSKDDLAKAAGLNVETMRWWEQQHARRPHPVTGRGYGPKRIASALRQAGVVLKHDPVGVVVDPDRYETDIRPPILQRREKTGSPTCGGRSANSRPSADCSSGNTQGVVMTPEQDVAGRRAQLRKLRARLEEARVLDKIQPRGPVTLAVFFGDASKASLALRWRRQATEPRHFLEVLTISPEDVARPLVRFAVNDLDALASELLQAVASLLNKPPANADEAAA